MYKIDAHQHFWKFDPVRDSWITEEMDVIRRDFLPQDLMHILMHNQMQGCVAVQASQTEKENQFLLELASTTPFVKGVVGWVDLQAEDVEEQLKHYGKIDKMVGFRHVLQGEPQRDLMLKPEFKRGISLLHKYGFTYDVLIFADQLKYTAQLVAEFPKQQFVIDHIAKPDIKNKQVAEWEKDIREVAKHPNVYCKISGMVTEANWYDWEEEDFKPYMDVVFDAFGIDRLMFGSDWPVCMVAGGYNRVVKMVRHYLEPFSDIDKAKFWGGNAIKFYNLEV
ncbi:amidohydrolase family protein [Mucilaginibacter aquatilis]|uniref:Amidohydrolase family protein n=1 Tax=Mucilaginibacter aquatilis TaxID=1517760 RepID=A0A6I4IPI9_9SPHI|nr:amidohydrolase family protein [Mucilaginibacter aquatilis]MVN90083.1 amidohydrolase family protein [Mucilaginibacter aquatilis]